MPRRWIMTGIAWVIAVTVAQACRAPHGEGGAAALVGRASGRDDGALAPPVGLPLRGEAEFAAARAEMRALFPAYEKVLAELDARGAKEAFPNLREEERMAVHFATGAGGSDFARVVRCASAQEPGPYRETLRALASALAKLPREACVARRAVPLRAEALAAWRAGGAAATLYAESAFLTATRATKAAPIPRAMGEALAWQTVRSPACIRVDGLARFPAEEEVMFPPSSVFAVTAVPGTAEFVLDHRPHAAVPVGASLFASCDGAASLPAPGAFASPGGEPPVAALRRIFRARRDLAAEAGDAREAFRLEDAGLGTWTSADATRPLTWTWDARRSLVTVVPRAEPDGPKRFLHMIDERTFGEWGPAEGTGTLKAYVSYFVADPGADAR